MAFDGHRKGFILGVGVGPSLTSFTQSVRMPSPTATSDRENKAGVATDFRIGGGVTERFLLYYVNRVAWFSLHNALGKNVTIASSVGLLGASYYFRETSPSPFIVGLLGLSAWSAPFEEGSGSQTGLGLGAGAGYDISRHWSVEGNLDFGSPSDEAFGTKVSTHAVSLHCTIHVLAF
jgi:opacity protein-like surface antigen